MVEKKAGKKYQRMEKRSRQTRGSKKGEPQIEHIGKKYMDWKYQLDAKGYLYIIQQLKVKILRACIKIRQYNKNQLQYHQNKLFSSRPINLGCTVNSMAITFP